jgi:hypothetical protein
VLKGTFRVKRVKGAEASDPDLSCVYLHFTKNIKSVFCRSAKVDSRLGVSMEPNRDAR